MAVSRVTSWTDNTETQVHTGAVRVAGVEIIKNPSQAVANWVHLWNAANPDLGANDAPSISFYVPPPAVDQKYSLAYRTNVYFDTGLSWFVGEDAGDFGEAPDTYAPLSVRVFYALVS